jgi:hypothetical protein
MFIVLVNYRGKLAFLGELFSPGRIERLYSEHDRLVAAEAENKIMHQYLTKRWRIAARGFTKYRSSSRGMIPWNS